MRRPVVVTRGNGSLIKKWLLQVPYWYLLVIPPVVLYLGSALNVIVAAINHGRMPVLFPGGACDPAYFEDSLVHACMNSKTHLKFLADWINLASSQQAILSPGDLLIDLGQYLLSPALYIWVVLMVKERKA